MLTPPISRKSIRSNGLNVPNPMIDSLPTADKPGGLLVRTFLRILGQRRTRMDYAPINKPSLDEFKVKPNLWNYEEARRKVTWEDIRGELDGTPGGGLNLAYE